MRKTKARDLDPQTRKYVHALRAIVAARAEFATTMPARERRDWLKECDWLLARPALRKKAKAVDGAARRA